MGPRTLRSVALVLALWAGGLLNRVAHAQGGAVDRAAAFLGTRDRGGAVLQLLHMGKQYRGQAFKELRLVRDGDGDQVPGHFALVYRYDWGTDGMTDLAFLCDAAGVVYKVDVVGSNALLHQPFLAANASIKLVGGLVLAALADDLGDEDRRLLARFVVAADAQGLLAWTLHFQQLLE